MILVVTDLTMSDGGEYTCVASNELGEISFTFILEIQREY